VSRIAAAMTPAADRGGGQATRSGQEHKESAHESLSPKQCLRT